MKKGRPKKKAHDRKTESLRIPLTPAQKLEYEKVAADCEMATADWARRILNAAVKDHDSGDDEA